MLPGVRGTPLSCRPGRLLLLPLWDFARECSKRGLAKMQKAVRQDERIMLHLQVGCWTMTP